MHIIIIKTRNTFCLTRSLSNHPMELFHLEQAQRDVYPVQNLLLCTKFRKNQMIFIARQHTDARY